MWRLTVHFIQTTAQSELEQSFISKTVFTACMGRIKTMLIKRVTNQLMDEHPGKFTTDFQENKAIVEELSDVSSKKIRNIIAGYATRLKKKQEAQAL